MKNIVCFLLLPMIAVIMKISYIDSINTLLGYMLFVIVNVAICFALFMVIKKIYNKRQTDTKTILIGGVVLSLIDQIVKVIVYHCDLHINIIGYLFRIEQTKNINQMAVLNYFNLVINDVAIIIYKSIIVAAILFAIYKIKNKSVDLVCAFVLLLSAAFANLLDSICWGYTLDYFYFNKLICYDLKDFYVDAAVGIIIMLSMVESKERAECKE